MSGRIIAAALLCSLLLGPGLARAATMHVMESKPVAEAVMDGHATEFFIRFDGPVDHSGSVLSVLRDDQVVETLHPRLNSQPSVLYATAPRLSPGRYVLRWSTRSVPDLEGSQGDIAFTVK